MAIYLRQSTTSQEIPLGYFVDSTDGNTEETALSIANTDIKLWKTGATTLANKNSGGATHISNGIYYTVLDDTDTNTIGPMVVFVHVSGALTVRVECCVLDEAVYDVLFGTTALATTTNITAAAGITLADGAITAAKIGADAITAAKVASDVSAEIADAVWDEATTGHTTAGTFGEQLKTDVDAILDDTGTAGVAVASGAISSTTFAAGAIDSAAIAANAIGASELAQDAAREIADEVLDRDLAGGASGGARNVRNALRVLRNKAAIAAGTLTVYQEDDTTSAWTAAVGTTAGDPISSVDPA